MLHIKINKAIQYVFNSLFVLNFVNFEFHYSTITSQLFNNTELQNKGSFESSKHIVWKSKAAWTGF